MSALPSNQDHLDQAAVIEWARCRLSPSRSAHPDAPLEAIASLDQQRMWRLEHTAGAGSRTSPYELRKLPLSLDVTALTSAIEAVVERHEVLRTTFLQRGDELYQIVGEPQPIVLPCTHLPKLEPERSEVLHETALAAVTQSFNLISGPVFRAMLFRDDEHFYLLLVIHHIAYDKWSSGVLLADLAELYAAHRAARRPSLISLSMNYRQFAAWQRLQSCALNDERLYWRQQLHNVDCDEWLPITRPRPSTPCSALAEPLNLAPAMVRRMQAVASRAGASLFMVILAALCATVSAWSGRSDIVIGCPVITRPLPEVEPMVGLFVNMLPIRLIVDLTTPFLLLVEQAREKVLSAYEHQSLFFDDMLAEADLVMNHGSAPLIRVVFAYDDIELMTANPSLGLPMEIDLGLPAAYDLTVFARRTEDGIQGEICYPAGLFSPTSVRCLARDLLTVLNSRVDGVASVGLADRSAGR